MCATWNDRSSRIAATAALALLMLSWPPQARAEMPSQKLGWLSMEANPVFFAFEGYFLKLSVEPEKLQGWSVGVTALSVTMPPSMAELITRRQNDQGFGDLIWEPGSIGVDVGRFFGKNHDGVHVGLLGNIMRVRAERGSDAAKFVSFVPAIRVGYRWFPGHGRTLFLEPAFAVGSEFRLAGDDEVQGIPYPTAGLIVATGFHVGVRI